jgi:2-amino-4-hydroxy-6-hydroxymethyldihydropteridine diphosphokinase
MQLSQHTNRYKHRRRLQKDEIVMLGVGMILIGIGANLPTPEGAAPLATCRAAAAALDDIPGLRLVGLSRWFRTAPVPPSGQPDYINAVARLRGVADPATLLAALQAIEAAAGRWRGARDAARTLDLDILAMGPLGGLCRPGPDPVLPHPRACAASCWRRCWTSHPTGCIRCCSAPPPPCWPRCRPRGCIRWRDVPWRRPAGRAAAPGAASVGVTSPGAAVLAILGPVA